MKIIPLLFLLVFSTPVAAQRALIDSVNSQRSKLNCSGMAVLGSWALANVANGLITQANSTGRQKQFYKTNVIWGGINLVVAGAGYLREKGKHSSNISNTFHNQSVIEKLFLFNTGLDLGYIAFGLYLREKGNRFSGDKLERLKGTGNSFLVQGGFLFLFDGIMYLLHAKNGARLYLPLDKLAVGLTQNGYGLVYRF